MAGSLRALRPARVVSVGVLGWIFLVVVFCSALPVSAQLQPCPGGGDCATITAAGPGSPVPRGQTTNVVVNFTPGSIDASAGGLDNIAALTFSLGIPGLELADCQNPSAD